MSKEKRERKGMKLNEGLKALVRTNLKHFVRGIEEASQLKGTDADPPITGADRLDRAVEIVNGLIDIPWLPEGIEELLFKAILTGIVEIAKHLFGEAEWLDRLKASSRRLA